MKPHLPSALRRALLACCSLSVGLTLSSGIAAADTTLGKTDTITIDYAASSTQTPLDADGVLTLTGDTKLMLLNMGDITGFSYTLCTGVSGLQTADGELTLTTGNNSAEAYFDTTAPGSSIWADATLQWVSDRLLLVLNNTRVKDSVTITERQTGSVDYQEYKGVSFESITGGTIIGLGDSTMSNNGSVSFSNNSNNKGGAIFADWCTITMSKNGSVSFNANSADDNGGAIDVHYEGELTLSNNGSVSFLENKATADGGAIFGSDDSSITLSGNGSISFIGNISYLDGGAMTGLFGTTIELNNNSSIIISENTAARNGGAIHDYESSISLNENGSVSFSKNAADGNGGAANIESDGLFTLSNNGNVSFSENTADLSGGAIFANWCPITLNDNGSVSFSGNKANQDGGAIYGSTITLNGNGNVEFIKNQGSGGSAIYGNTIELNRNESVKFSENNSPDSSTIEGSRGSRITISDNGRVEFSKNHGAHGGAFYSPVCQLSMCNNDSVTFIENTTASIYDVIGLESGSTISLNHNGSISFIRNTAANALSSYMEELSLSHNGSVTFEENKSRAILAYYGSTIKLSNNGSVSICRNKGGHGSAISVEGDVAKLVLDNNDSVKFVGNIDEMERYNWGVLYGRWGSTIIICNNREVLFEKNITNRWSDNNIFLRSIYSTGELGGLATLVMGAPENGNITFSDSIYADGVVELNAAYDHDGDASTAPIAQSGTITFTGEQAEADLKSYLDDNNITLSTSKLAAAIRQSKTSTLNATTTLYDGTLEVKKGAILEVGNTLTVNDGATLAITDNGQLRNSGTLTLNGKTILGSTISNSGTVKLGGTIDISGITPYETGISVRVNEFGYEGTRSGFLREGDCRIKVVNGGTIEDTGATIDYNGEVMTGVSTLEDGIVQVKTQDINYREYLLENTDNATYSNIATASGGQLERISLRGGILNLDSSLDSGVTLKILGDIPQSIDMWENVVLSKGSLEELSDSRELIISGRASSVYEITGELGLGAGVSLKDWNGTVRATDTTLSSGGVDTTEWKNTELKGLTTVRQGATLTLGGNVLLCGKISNSGTLNLTGNITVDAENYAPEDAVKEVLDYYIGASALPNTKNSGFESAAWDITIAEGGVIDGSAATWTVTGIDAAGLRFDSDGTLHAYGKEVGSVFHVAAGDSIIYGSGNAADFTNSKGTEATGISLNGGTLVLNTALRDTSDDYVKSTAASTVEIGNGVELNASQLDASAADVTLGGAGGYTMESGANTLGSGVSVGSDWRGTVNTTGDTSALELDTLGVSGSKVDLGSDCHTLADRDQSAAADLNSTGSISLTGKELTLSGNNTLGSLSVGSLAITGGSTTVSNGLTTAGESSVADGASLSIDGASALGGKITLGTGSTLTLDGTITVNKDSFAPEDAVVEQAGYFIGNATTPNSTNSGFEAACWDITIAEGGTITDKGADWQLEGDVDADFSFESDGTLHAYGSDVGSVFHVAEDDSITYGSENEDDFKNSKGVDATGISLNGGTLVLNTALRDNREDYVKSTAASTVEIGSDVELKAAQLDASAANVTLAGTGGYDLENGSALAGGVKLGNDWSGTVYTGAIAAGTESLDVNHLGNTDSTVQLGKNGDASMNSLTADEVGTVVTPGALSLMSQTSRVQHLTVKGGLTLGSADSAATLIATGALSTQGITLGNIGSSASAAMLLDDTLNLTVADSELLKLTGNTTVLTLGTAYAGTTTLNGEKEVLGSNGKMIYTLVWQTPLTRAVASTSLVLQADTNPVYVQNKVGEQVKHYSYNGPAGLRILNAAYAEHNPQQNAAGGALAGLIDTVDAGKMTDRDMAAVAGSSTAVLGQALSGDVERQLRAIRNRTAMSNHGTNSVAWDGKGGLVTTSLPSRYFAWVNAEGNRAEQNADGTAPGYTLNSWGGTVGTGMQVNSSLTMGLALSAMYGDLRSDGPDSLDGDMDTTYLSAFARYESGKWSHAFIGTAGTMEADYKRTVSHATDSYHTYGDTDGTAFGLMYEVSRDFTLGSKGTLSPVFNISYRHAEVDGYRESGADAALNVGEQSLDTMTLGLGARYAAVVGERAFNRACAFEARALAKYDFGDTQNNIGVGFVNQATHANIESAEMGAFGVELGAGISVPVGKGSIFADGSVELRSDYTNCNATVGYKIQF